MNRRRAASTRARRPASAAQAWTVSSDRQIAAFTLSGSSMLSRLLCGPPGPGLEPPGVAVRSCSPGPPCLSGSPSAAVVVVVAVAREGSSRMTTYRMVYGDDEQVVRETYTDIDEVEREDGWVVLFRGKEAILRVQEAHVQSMEQLDE